MSASPMLAPRDGAIGAFGRFGPSGPFGTIAGVARVTVLLAFALIVLGAVVRSTGSGLACPDWPLCHGRLVPPLQTQVWLEWSHRFVALLVSLCALGLAVVVFASRAARGRLGGAMALVLALLASQIVLGALTVWKLLHFSVVTLHLGNALLFFAALLALAEKARRLAAGENELEGKPSIASAREEQNVYGGPRSRRGGVRGLSEETERSSDAGRRSRPADSSSDAAGASRPATRGWLATAAIATFAQILLGGLVSTNHAGLACPDFPGCHGRLFPPLEGLVGLQMTHRFGAYALALLLGAVAWRARGATDVRIAAAAQAALALTGLQILLGVLNVWLTVPVWLSAAHLATATALFALLVLASLRS